MLGLVCFAGCTNYTKHFCQFYTIPLRFHFDIQVRINTKVVYEILVVCLQLIEPPGLANLIVFTTGVVVIEWPSPLCGTTLLVHWY